MMAASVLKFASDRARIRGLSSEDAMVWHVRPLKTFSRVPLRMERFPPGVGRVEYCSS